MTRAGMYGTVGAIIGFLVAAIACALAQWLQFHSSLLGFDLLVRILVPFSGGMKHLAELTVKGRFVTQMGIFNAAIYGVIGFAIGLVVQLLHPVAPED